MALYGVQLISDLLLKGSEIAHGKQALRHHEALEAANRVPFACGLDFGAIAIVVRIVRGVMKSDAVRSALDERRSAARECARYGGGRRRVHSKKVVTINADSGHAIPDRAIGDAGGRGLLMEWN